MEVSLWFVSIAKVRVGCKTRVFLIGYNIIEISNLQSNYEVA